MWQTFPVMQVSDLKNFQLNSFMLAEIYKGDLVLIDEVDNSKSKPEEKKQGSTKSEEKNELKPARFLGGNEKKIMIVVAEEKHPFLGDEELHWLQKMLQACQLTLADVAIVNIRPVGHSIKALKEQFSARKLILLGASPTELQLPLNFPQFKLQEHDECIYLYAPSARELNQETNEGKLLKSKLWVSLQKLFEV